MKRLKTLLFAVCIFATHFSIASYAAEGHSEKVYVSSDDVQVNDDEILVITDEKVLSVEGLYLGDRGLYFYMNQATEVDEDLDLFHGLDSDDDDDEIAEEVW